MDRRIRKVVHILPTLIFSPTHNSEDTDDGDGSRKKDRLLLEQAAEAVNLSASRLRQLFKAEMGVTLKQYADRLRMEKAMEMAKNTDLTISQILAEIRAIDESHFRRNLKRAYGMTLSEYRKLCDGEVEEERSREDSDKDSSQSNRPAISHFGSTVGVGA